MIPNFRRRDVLIALSCVSMPTFADAQVEDAKAADPLKTELTGVVLPVVRENAPVTYLFCVIVIQLRDAASAFYFRENHFLLRDAITRIVSRSPIPAGATPSSFDRVAVTRVVLRAIQAVRPSTQVVRVTVANPDFMRN